MSLKMSRSSSLLLYLLLVQCEEEGIDAPAKTAHIRVDDRLIHRLRMDLAVDGYPISATTVYRAFHGMPVKAVRGVVRSAIKNTDELLERDQFLLRYASKRERREAS